MTKVSIIAHIAEYITFIGLFIASILTQVSIGNSNAADWFEERIGKKPLDYFKITEEHKSTARTLIRAISLIIAVYSFYSFYAQATADIERWFASPPVARCAQQGVFDAALADGVDGLRAFIRECPGGSFRAKAEAALKDAEEKTAFQSALACFSASSSPARCSAADLDICLGIYASTSRTKGGLDELKSRIVEERESSRCKPAPPPPSSPCQVQSGLDKATADGVEGLRTFIRECPETPLRKQAETALNAAEENAEYQRALTCVQVISSLSACVVDALNACLNTYVEAFSSGRHLSELQAAVRKGHESSRCQPRPNPPAPALVSPPPSSTPDPPIPSVPIPPAVAQGTHTCDLLRKWDISFGYTFSHCTFDINGRTAEYDNGVLNFRLDGTLHLDDQDRIHIFHENTGGLETIVADLNQETTRGTTITKIGDSANGKEVIRRVNIPFAASARIADPEIAVSYSWNFTGAAPTGGEGQFKKAHSLRFTLRNERECQIAESTMSDYAENLNLNNAYREFLCGPKLMKTTCKVVQRSK